MLIIMGTSLKVHGLKKLVKEFAKAVHATSSPSSSPSTIPKKRGLSGKVIFVNKTAPGAEWSDVIDYHVGGETDRWVEKVIDDWKKMRPADWEVQKTLDGDGDISMGGLKAVKDVRTLGKGNLNPLQNDGKTNSLLFPLKEARRSLQQAWKTLRLSKHSSPAMYYHQQRYQQHHHFRQANDAKLHRITLTPNAAHPRNAILL
jgi:hypothetical protein